MSEDDKSTINANSENTAQAKARRLQGRHSNTSDEFGWFEALYSGADRDISAVPWEGKAPVFKLQERLAELKRSGGAGSAIDVGCGLGHHAFVMADAGFDVTAFDVSETAIAWARERFAETSIKFETADLFNLPQEWLGRFDFVHETYTLQALPRDLVSSACHKVASMLAPGGTLIVICRGREPSETPDGPPWPLARSQLDEFTKAGLIEEHFEEFLDSGQRATRHFLFEYCKPA